MKKAAFVFLAFFVVSIGLTWLWNEGLRQSYSVLFRAVAEPLYETIGFGDARIAPLRTRYINFIPFVSLVLVTPGIRPRRRGIGLGLGIGAIFASHLALNLTAAFSPGASLPIVAALFSDALPFLLWLVVAYPTLIGFLPGPPNEPTETEPGVESEDPS